jgi:hypothetical protein
LKIIAFEGQKNRGTADRKVLGFMINLLVSFDSTNLHIKN